MKTFALKYIFISLLLLLALIADAQQCGDPRWITPTPHLDNVNVIKFLDKQNGILGDNTGNLFKTNDTGKTWINTFSFHKKITDI